MREALAEQFLPDGVHIERTPGYHDWMAEVAANYAVLPRLFPEADARVDPVRVRRALDYGAQAELFGVNDSMAPHLDPPRLSRLAKRAELLRRIDPAAGEPAPPAARAGLPRCRPSLPALRLAARRRLHRLRRRHVGRRPQPPQPPLLRLPLRRPRARRRPRHPQLRNERPLRALRKVHARPHHAERQRRQPVRRRRAHRAHRSSPKPFPSSTPATRAATGPAPTSGASARAAARAATATTSACSSG